jgi:hypothetical protein
MAARKTKKPKVTPKRKQRQRNDRGTRSHVARSPHLSEIVSWLKAGWAPRTVSRELTERYEEKISESSLTRYRRDFVPYTERIPARLRDRLFRGLDGKIDAIQELTNQIAVQEQRISRSLDIEESLKVGLPETNRQIELRHKMLCDLVRILQETGKLPCRQSPLVKIDNHVEVKNTTTPRLKDLLGRLDENSKKIFTGLVRQAVAGAQEGAGGS